MKDQDFGCYGKGAEGYAHYKQDFDRIHGGGAGGPSGDSGCLGCLMMMIGIPVLLAALAGVAWVMNWLF